MINQLFKFSFIIFTVLSLGSCKKELDTGNTVVKGVVKNSNNNQPVANVPVLVSICKSDGFLWFGSTTCDEFKTVYSDASGRYEISFNAENDHFYQVSIPGNNKFPYVSAKTLISKSVNEVDFSAKPFRVLKLNYKIIRHDRNYVYSFLQPADIGDFYSHEFYKGINPVADLDTVFYSPIQGQRDYVIHVILCNKITPVLFADSIVLHHFFNAPDVDTVFKTFILQ